MNREAIKRDFPGDLDAGKVKKATSDRSEAETCARARDRFATLWATVKAWDEAIRDRMEGASVRYLFEKVSRDGVIPGRVSASRPGRAALNVHFQIRDRTLIVTIGVTRRTDTARERTLLITALRTAIVDCFVQVAPTLHGRDAGGGFDRSSPVARKDSIRPGLRDLVRRPEYRGVPVHVA